MVNESVEPNAPSVTQKINRVKLGTQKWEWILHLHISILLFWSFQLLRILYLTDETFSNRSLKAFFFLFGITNSFGKWQSRLFFAVLISFWWTDARRYFSLISFSAMRLKRTIFLIWRINRNVAFYSAHSMCICREIGRLNQSKSWKFMVFNQTEHFSSLLILIHFGFGWINKSSFSD